MATAGERTRDNILNVAFKLFAQKGFSAVSMSDFCRECELSRGGLYRHFSSTAQIFEAMLARDKDNWTDSMQRAFSKGVPAPQMLRHYLDRMYAGMIAGDGRLSLAACEYARTSPKSSTFTQARCKIATDMFAALLEYGCSRDEFRPCDIRATAEHYVIFIDGLRIAAVCVPLTPETVLNQLNMVASSIIKE